MCSPPGVVKANLLMAELNQEQLEETTRDENTKLPSGRKPPAHWNVKTDEQAEEDRAHSRTSENTWHSPGPMAPDPPEEGGC